MTKVVKGKLGKSLLIFDLNGTLGYLTKEHKTVGSAGMYNRNEHELFKLDPSFVQ